MRTQITIYLLLANLVLVVVNLKMVNAEEQVSRKIQSEGENWRTNSMEPKPGVKLESRNVLFFEIIVIMIK